MASSSLAAATRNSTGPTPRNTTSSPGNRCRPARIRLLRRCSDRLACVNSASRVSKRLGMEIPKMWGPPSGGPEDVGPVLSDRPGRRVRKDAPYGLVPWQSATTQTERMVRSIGGAGMSRSVISLRMSAAASGRTPPTARRRARDRRRSRRACQVWPALTETVVSVSRLPLSRASSSGAAVDEQLDDVVAALHAPRPSARCGRRCWRAFGSRPRSSSIFTASTFSLSERS